MFSTNVTGLINMTQAVLPIYKKRGDGGKGDIINIGSIAGREGYPQGSIYCATKAAVRTFTDAMRRELIATRIRVIEVVRGYQNAILPSWRLFLPYIEGFQMPFVTVLYTFTDADLRSQDPGQVETVRGCRRWDDSR